VYGEHLNVDVRRSWTDSDLMPRLPLLGTGLSPIIQWVVVPAYKRALWTVLLVNLGYGVIEISGGFLAGSQALKADALDFLGDGTITLLGVLAITWGRPGVPAPRSFKPRSLRCWALAFWLPPFTAPLSYRFHPKPN